MGGGEVRVRGQGGGGRLDDTFQSWRETLRVLNSNNRECIPFYFLPAMDKDMTVYCPSHSICETDVKAGATKLMDSLLLSTPDTRVHTI